MVLNLFKRNLRKSDQSSSGARQDRIAKFKRQHDYSPDLSDPKTFSEKLLKRILDGRDPLYPLYGVKLAAPMFASEKNIKGLHFINRIKVCGVLAKSDFDDLPNEFVAKASFGSGLNRIVRDKSTADIAEICDFFNSRLTQVRNAQGANDFYNSVIFEELMQDEDGEIPTDLKFHCFNGPDGSFKHLLQIDSQRFGEHKQSIMDEHFETLPIRFGKVAQHEAPPAQPDQLADATRIAKQLSQGFDYVRIDLYSVKGKIYFGEFTPFHQGANGRVSPADWDRKLGDMWNFRLPAFQGP